MKIGFTGTQEGMSVNQKSELENYLNTREAQRSDEFHHGDCIGADLEAAIIATDAAYEVHSHPPTDPKKRAFHKSNVVHPKEPYLIRNRRIVDATKILIAAPKSDKEELRSGTWATIRYARKLGRKVILLKR